MPTTTAPPPGQIAELWIDATANIYYRMNNWHGFYQVIVNNHTTAPRGGSVKAVPAGAKQLIANGAAVTA